MILEDTITIFDLKQWSTHKYHTTIMFNDSDDYYNSVGDFTYEWLLEEATSRLKYSDNAECIIGVTLGSGTISPIVDQYAEDEYHEFYLKNH